MTDNRNTILAVILSGLVLIAWQYFYNMPQMEKQRAADPDPEPNWPSRRRRPTPGIRPPRQPGAAPSATTPANQPAAARPSSAATPRSPPRRASRSTRRGSTGSISLKGARIDDLALVQFRDTVDPKSPAIVLFSPSGTAHPYYAEFGWVAAAGSTVRIPDQDTVWQQEGSGSAVAEQSGDAEIRQWRRPHLPPHHCDRRPLSLHHQG